MQERRNFRPNLDRLEDRAVPAGLPYGGYWIPSIQKFAQTAVSNLSGQSPDYIPQQQVAAGVPPTTQAFVAKVDTVLLGNPNSVTQVAFYSPVTTGFTLRAVGVLRTLRSQEYVNNYVTDQYQQILGRAPDPTGLAVHTNPLQFGADLKTTTLSLATSDEFYVKSGNTNSNYVNNLFQALLGHAPSASDAATLTAGLDNGTMSRTDVASYVIYSTEYNSLLVTDMYQTILGRAPDPAGLAAGVDLLNTGHRVQGVMLILLTSEEFSVGL